MKKDSQVFGDFPETPRYLGNFPDTTVFKEFPIFPKSLKDFKDGIFLKILEISYNFKINQPQILQEFGEFPRFPDIWGIPQNPRYLRKCLGTWELLKCLGFWEISQMPGYMGNFPNAWVSRKFPKCLGFGKFPRFPGI